MSKEMLTIVVAAAVWDLHTEVAPSGSGATTCRWWPLSSPGRTRHAPEEVLGIVGSGGEVRAAGRAPEGGGQRCGGPAVKGKLILYNAGIGGTS